MKAVTYDRFGSPEVLKISEVENPTARTGELVVRVRAAAVNPLDWKIRTGAMGLLAGKKLPKRTGFDFSGVVESLGKDVADFNPGDEVVGIIEPFNAHNGTLAERCVAKPELVIKKPAGLTFAEAAMLPCAGMSALQSLRLGKVATGSRVLLIGATGGLGIFAIPLAKRLGAHVTAVCSSHGVSLAKELGADVVINRETENPLAPGAGYDAVLDLAAVHTFAKCRHRLNPRGVYVNTLPGIGTLWSQCWTALFSSRKARMLILKSNADDLRTVAELASSGALRPFVCQPFVFDEKSVREMHSESEKGSVLGKLVVTLPEI